MIQKSEFCLKLLLFFSDTDEDTDDTDYHIVTQPAEYEETLYFELLEPSDISFTYRIRPAKDFGVILVSGSVHELKVK